MNRRQFAATLAAGLGAPRGTATLGSLFRLDRRAAPRVDGDRLNRHLTGLSRFGANPQGGVTRLAYSEADRQAREYVLRLIREAKLVPAIDAAGNIIASRPGRDAARKPILFGSHIDSVPEGGNYDGDVGSMAAIEVAQTLAE